MGFPSHPNTTNGDIMKNEYGFVLWMRKKREDGELFSGRMTDFIDWVESPEGKKLETETLQQRRSVEIEEQGKEIFNFGKHKGRTFAQIAMDDPEYHTRYMYLHGEAPLPVLARYISWFEKIAICGINLHQPGRGKISLCIIKSLPLVNTMDKHSNKLQERIHHII